MQLQLETPAQEEWPVLVDIWEAAVRATHHFLPDTDLLLIKPLLASQYFPAVQLTCARDSHGRITGFLGCAGNRVEMLFVDPARHGLGIGTRLMRHAIDQLGVTRVDVNEQNPAALAFYRKLGFEVLDRSRLDGGGRPFPILHLGLATTV
ncbi:GNAT family N-acetyltransferase [Pseudomonas sp. NCCP-436]|uniref:GNAT family N-acetyltransferase n=1 Tax=Pseudomonas sp. NCCP-436 TaxID=2842481 RepID=UPI001C81ABD3|nr:GNAT family N-acetyltransferase [Pseudomonas sp. NCCP-436]